MRQHSWFAAGLLVAVAAPLSWATHAASLDSNAAPTVARAAWTVLLYMAADGDLEDCQVDNVQAMLEVGSGRDVQVVMLLDRSAKGEHDRSPAQLEAEPAVAARQRPMIGPGPAPGGRSEEPGAEAEPPAYTSRSLRGAGSWSGAKLLHVQRGRLRELADWGPVNSADPVILKRFLDTATRRFPAEHYALVLNDHGFGWSGACHDESYDNILTTLELQTVLAQATRSIGPLDLLGFDACLMANVEVCQAVAPFARVIVASEELEPGEGWDYVSLFRQLQLRPSASGLDIGEMIARTFREYFAQHDDEVSAAITLSVIRSDAVPAVAQAASDLAAALRDELAAEAPGKPGTASEGTSHKTARGADFAWSKVARARARTVEYGRLDSAEGAGHLDLVHLCDLLTKEFPQGPVAAACDRLRSAVEAAVVVNVHSAANPNSHGLTIFFPATREMLLDDYDLAYETLEFCRQGEWFDWLLDYLDSAERPEFQSLRELGKP